MASTLPRLHVHRWPAAPPVTASLLLIHGLGEHAGRYGHFAQRLNAAGIVVLAPDLPGHGRSSGARGDAEGFATMVDAIEPFWREVDERKPRFLLGHSFGGLLAVQLALRRGAEVNGLVLSSPFFGFGTPPKPWQRVLSRWMLKLAPGLGLPTGLDPNALARDPQVAIDYRADALVHDRLSARLLAEAQITHRLLPALSPRLSMPTLIWHGDADRLTSFGASAAFARGLTHAKSAFIAVSGGYHELLNDHGHQRIEDQLLEWLAGLMRAS